MQYDGLNVRHLGLQPYEPIWQAMTHFTSMRDQKTIDELWFVEHTAVYTQGQAGKPEHLLQKTSIPLVQSDRGGQITYHGPGQMILYPLLDIRRRGMGVRDLVTLLEQLVVQWLSRYGIEAHAKAEAPGVYVSGGEHDAKIASLGLRIRRGCSFHGVSINIDMDLSPFQNINPCGYKGLPMTQLKDLISQPLPQIDSIVSELSLLFAEKLGIPSSEAIIKSVDGSVIL